MRCFKILAVIVLYFIALSCQDDKSIEVLELDIPKNTIPEGIAILPQTGEILISSVHLNTITKSDSKGEKSETFLPKDYCGYSEGVGMEIFKNKLYALGRFNRKKRSILVIKDLDDSDNYNAECFSLSGDVTSYFNDLAVDNDGNAYMTDTDSHKVYFYNANTNTINVFMVDEEIQYPNGIAISDDNSKLFIDSYTHGIRIVDIETKKILNAPHEESTKIGIDGLKYHQGNLYAIRNGGRDKSKHGLYQFLLNKSQDDIIEKKILLEDHEKMNLPTTLAISNNYIYILANSQLDNLDQEKNEIINTDKLTNTFVIKFSLDN